MRSSSLASVSVLALATGLSAQFYQSGFETLNASAAGTIVTGQDGYYIPVTGSLDWNVITYTGNALGVPQNTNGGNNFIAGVSQLTNIFARCQRNITLPSSGRVYIQYDVLCNYMGTGTPANNIGSFSFQPSTNATYVNLLARWPVGATAPPPTWDADVVAGTGTIGTTTTVAVGDPAFQNLPVNVWHTWGCTIDMTAGVHVDFRIRNGSTGIWTTFVPTTPVLLPVAGSAILPTDFRFFAGGSENLFAIDNVLIAYGATFNTFGSGCAGSLGVPTLTASGSGSPQIGTTFSIDFNNLPNGVGILTTGFSNTVAFGSVPLPFALAGNGFPGCDLLVDPLVGQFLVGAGNTATWSLAIPNSTSYVGLSFYHQGVALDNVAPFAAFSAGARTLVGH